MSSQDSSSTVTRGNTSTSSSTEEKSAPGPINVEIQGQRLSIRSDRDPAFVQRLARYIDHIIEDLQNSAPTVPLEKLLMLASMTVAEELFETREELEELRSDLDETTDTMFELLDQVEEI